MSNTTDMHLLIGELSLTLVSFANIAIGFFVLYRRPRSSIAAAFSIMTSGVGVWGLGIIFLTRTEAFAWNTVVVYGFLLTLYGLVIFAKVFPDARPVSKGWYAIPAIPLLVIALLTPAGLIIRGAVFHAGQNPEPINGPLFPLFVAVTAAYICVSVGMFMRTFKRRQGADRTRMYYFIFGIVLFLVLAAVFNVILPAFGIFEFNFLGPISSIILTAVTARAIMRRHLMDIRIVIQRGLIYFVFIGAAAAFYIASLQFLGQILLSITGAGTVISAGVTMALGIIFWEPTRAYLEKITDPIFFKDGYDYADTLGKLSHILHKNVAEPAIVTASCALLKETFKTEYAAIRTACDTASVEAIVAVRQPIVFEERTIGCIELGEKRSGDAYTDRDKQLLETFATQAAVALEKGRLYREVEEYNSRLEQLVEKRTAELRKAHDDQKQAVLDISHNLQTPIAVIRGELELLVKDETEPEKVRTVRRSLDRVSSFIRQMLRLARLDTSEESMEMSRINLADIIREQGEYFETMAAEQDIELVAACPDEAWVIGNKKLIEELLANLVANAIAYRSLERPSLIRVELAATDDRNELSIWDNGLGIAPEDIEHLFTRFYRAVRTSAIQGSGLGLAIAKNIAERHGGSIRAESKVGEWTKIIVGFPKI